MTETGFWFAGEPALGSTFSLWPPRGVLCRFSTDSSRYGCERSGWKGRGQ
jgi:hypothetical protein